MNKVVLFDGKLNSGLFSKQSVEYILENFGEDIYKLERHDTGLVYAVEHFEKYSGWGVVDIYPKRYCISEFQGIESVKLSSDEDVDWVYIEEIK